MIITDLQAENFRKYENLHLEDLPEVGLIAVNGNNEAGKSSVGDAICFALFGRTDKLSGEHIGKLVRWGEAAVKITLSFRHKGKHYRLTRVADVSGNQTASLWSSDEGRTLVDSTEGVADTVKEILGYGYPAFIRTFYWSQKVNEDGQADAESLQAMAGIKTYIKLDKELRWEKEVAEKEKETLGQQLSGIQAELDTVEIDKDDLPQLLEVRETLDEHQRSNLSLTDNIGEVRESYTQNHGLFHRFSQWSRTISWLTVLGIILLIVALLAWAVVAFMPELLDSIRPIAESEQNTWGRGLLWGGVIIAILTSLLMAFGWHIDSNRLYPLREKSVVLASALQDGSSRLNSSMGDLIGAKAEKYLNEHNLVVDDNSELKQWQSDSTHLHSLANKIRTYEAEPLDIIAAADGVSMVLENQNQSLSQCLTTIDSDVALERERVDKYMLLNAQVEDCQTRFEESQHQVLLKSKGIAMIHRASRHSIRNFNKIVHTRCSNLLSDFTQSSYNNLEIDNNFMPKVLSEEKGDYLDFEEVSAGTQRQIALAMRMSLANTLATSTDAGGQFIFLDEPFAFFDRERTTATINSLVSATADNLNQIWVTVQDIPPGLNAAFTVDCQQKTPHLRVGG